MADLVNTAGAAQLHDYRPARWLDVAHMCVSMLLDSQDRHIRPDRMSINTDKTIGLGLVVQCPHAIIQATLWYTAVNITLVLPATGESQVIVCMHDSPAAQLAAECIAAVRNWAGMSPDGEAAPSHKRTLSRRANSPVAKRPRS